jgi:hypothetical protein
LHANTMAAEIFLGILGPSILAVFVVMIAKAVGKD